MLPKYAKTLSFCARSSKPVASLPSYQAWLEINLTGNFKWKMYMIPFMSNKDADQPEHPQRLNSILLFVVVFLFCFLIVV